MTRDELRKIYTFLKKETGVVGVPSRRLGSKEGCMFADEPALYCARVVRCLSKYGKNIIFVKVEE